MGIIKNILLLPFLPLRLAWKWSSETAINGQPNGCAHVVATIVIAGVLYGGIAWGVMKLLGK